MNEDTTKCKAWDAVPSINPKLQFSKIQYKKYSITSHYKSRAQGHGQSIKIHNDPGMLAKIMAPKSEDMPRTKKKPDQRKTSPVHGPEPAACNEMRLSQV